MRWLGFGKGRGRQADAHYNRGITLAEASELDEAIAEFREAIRLQPEHVARPYRPGERPGGRVGDGRGDRGIPRGDPAPA